MQWEHEVLHQRFEQTQKERDELYTKFVKAIHEVQQKGNFKNLLLEKKLSALADTLEKKVILCNLLHSFCWDLCRFLRIHKVLKCEAAIANAKLNSGKEVFFFKM